MGRDYGNTQDYSEETARRIDEEVAKIMKEAHDRAHAILSSHADQMDLMASVLLERETVEGEACEALLDNKWDEYLAREDDIIAAKEAEEAAARAKDAELLAAQGEGDGASDTPGAPGAAPADPDAGETLADPNWRNEPVEPGRPGSECPLPHACRARRPRRCTHPSRGERLRSTARTTWIPPPTPLIRTRRIERGRCAWTRSSIVNIHNLRRG